MITTSVPVEGEDFVNRREVFRFLSSLQEINQNAALVGVRRIGKSSIAREFCRRLRERNINVIPVYFKVNENIGSPSRFALRLLVNLLEEYMRGSNIESPEELDSLEMNISSLPKIADRLKSNAFQALTRFLIAYYPPTSKNERQILERIMKFLEEFSREQKKKLALILDEFQDIIKLERFPSIGKGNLLSFFEGISSSQPHVWYCLTGSMVRMMDRILESSDAPLYGRFKKIVVKPFTEEDANLLVTKVSRKPVTGEGLKFLFTLSSGNPYYIVVLSTKAKFMTDIEGKKEIDKGIVEKSFYSELTEGDLNSHCSYQFETSLGKAGRASGLKNVILFIAENNGATPSEISKSLNRERGYISPILRDLINVDLITKINNKYEIIDPLLCLWLSYVYGHSEPQLKRIKKNITQRYQETISKLKSERGFLFESYLRELLLKFDNSKYHNKLLHKFESVKEINIYDESGIIFGEPSNIEIDAFCRGNRNWICEFKYRRELSGVKELKILIKKSKLLSEKMEMKIDRLCLISISGFSEEALEYAKTHNIWCIEQSVLNALLDKHHMQRLNTQFQY